MIAVNTMDIHEILQYLPHRYPFLLVDKVIDYKVGEYLIGVKNVSFNEPFFPGHFPQRPIFPGVLLMEALAQATGLLAFKTHEIKPDGKSLYYFAGIDNCRFKQPVQPGDQVILEVKLLTSRRNIYKFSAEAKVDGKVVASAELMTAEQVTA